MGKWGMIGSPLYLRQSCVRLMLCTGLLYFHNESNNTQSRELRENWSHHKQPKWYLHISVWWREIQKCFWSHTATVFPPYLNSTKLFFSKNKISNFFFFFNKANQPTKKISAFSKEPHWFVLGISEARRSGTNVVSSCPWAGYWSTIRPKKKTKQFTAWESISELHACIPLVLPGEVFPLVTHRPVHWLLW